MSQEQFKQKNICYMIFDVIKKDLNVGRRSSVSKCTVHNIVYERCDRFVITTASCPYMFHRVEFCQ